MEITEYFDKINPIQKFILVNKNSNNAELSELILIGLYVIDEVIKDNTGTKYAYYMNDDITVKKLLEESLKINQKEKVFLKSLVEVDSCKLIYRFTCARKFNIKDETIKQLRLNSWGNEYIEEKKLLEKYNKEYKTMYKYFDLYYKNNKNTYTKLLSNLLQEITEERADIIKQLNKKLEFKILS